MGLGRQRHACGAPSRPRPPQQLQGPEDCEKCCCQTVWQTHPDSWPLCVPIPINPGSDKDVRERAANLRKEYKNQGALRLQRCGAGGLGRTGMGRSVPSFSLCSIALLNETLFASAPLRTQGRAEPVQGHQVSGGTLGCVPSTGGGW